MGLYRYDDIEEFEMDTVVMVAKVAFTLVSAGVAAWATYRAVRGSGASLWAPCHDRDRRADR